MIPGDSWRSVVAAVLLMAGCGGADPVDPCVPSARPTLEIGSGSESFRPLGRAGELELVHGPQNGYHVDVGLRATGLEIGSFIEGHLIGWLGGEIRAEVAPWLDLECRRGGQVGLGVRLVYEVDPEDLVGRKTRIDAEIIDGRGKRAVTSAKVVVVDLLEGAEVGE